MKKLVYIVSGIDSAFNSQVVAYLNFISNIEFFENIYLCVGINSVQNIDSLPLLNAKVDLLTFRKYPDYPLIVRRTIYELKKVLQTIPIDENTIVHTRNEMTGWIAYQALKTFKHQIPKIYVDVRGSVKEEIFDFFNGSQIAKILKAILLKQVAQVYEKADAINVVSKELKNYLVNLYGVASSKISVIPCIANDNFVYDIKNRQTIRQKYGINDNEIVVVFASGGINLWQNADETIISFAGKGIKVLNLSKHIISHPNVISSYVPYNEMPKYLSAADIGIIFREQHIVNRVASPIKFAEYLACGLPVISNDGVEQIVDVVQTYGVGTIVTNLDELDEKIINDLRKINRQNIASIGQRLYGIQSNASLYISQYKILLKGEINENFSKYSRPIVGRWCS